jgi:hypothetical protein
MIPDFDSLFDRPIIILAAPRSGSTLLFETLSEARDVWTIGGESHQIIEGVKALNVNFGGVDSNRLTEVHATEPIIQFMRRRFARFLRDREGRQFIHRPDITRLRFVEKTPKNALRLPFMEKVFPGAQYVFLFRDVRANLSSMMEAWRSRRWVTYPKLDWQGPPWSLLLPPGWRNLDGCALEEICAFQWRSANQTVFTDLQQIPKHRWTTVNYQSLLDEPAKTMERLCEFAGLEVDERLRNRLGKPLPLSRYTHTRPAMDKWRKNEREIESVLDSLAETESQLAKLGYQRSS